MQQHALAPVNATGYASPLAWPSLCGVPLSGPSHVTRRYLRYARSKLCNVLTAAELQRRARDAGLPLTAASVSPGIVATNIWDNLPRFWRAPVRALVRRFCQTPRQVRIPPLCAPAKALIGWPVLYPMPCLLLARQACCSSVHLLTR